MRTIIFMFIFYVCKTHAGVIEHELSSSWKTASNIKDKNICEQIPEKHTSCTEAQKLLIEFDEKFSAKLHAEAAKIATRIQNLYAECLDKRFADCYPQNKNSISLNELTKMFKKLKSDPQFRYPNGGVGMCSYRAESLSYYLAEAGYKTKTIRIQHAPVLIAMNRDNEGGLTGEYDDYQGFHTLVAIDVNVRGKTVQYFLDPQYMEKPELKEDYFIKTIGQNCIETKKDQNSDDQFDFTKCYYYEDKQNSSSEDLLTLIKTINSPEDIPFTSCGWATGERISNRRISTQNKVMTDKLIRCTNAETPKEFVGKTVTSSTPSDLILHTYLNYEQTLKDRLEFTNKQIEILKVNFNYDQNNSFVKEAIKTYYENVRIKNQIENSLKSLDETIAIVKKNLKK